MCKPDWKDAPNWAQWLAQDESGLWNWYKEAPYMGDCLWVGTSTFAAVDEPSDGWRYTLEPRTEGVWHKEPTKTADDYMLQAMEEMADRAASRDTDKERSMKAAVEAFNALYGHGLTEAQGWQFMSLLKKARGAGGAYREDDYTDDVAYAALAAESAGKGEGND